MLKEIKEPLISIIVPVYNTSQYLKRCIDSIIKQSYKNLEILIIDDGSTDGSDVLCDEIKKNDERIKVFHKINGGLSSARNYGLDRMRGAYVGFVDSDDWIESNMLSNLYNNLIRDKAQISCCGIRWVSDIGETVGYFNNDLKIKHVFENKEALIEMTNNSIITVSFCDKLFKANLFDDLRLKEGVLFEDGLFMPQCFIKAKKITYTAEPMYNYCVYSESITRSGLSIKKYDIFENNRETIEFYKTHCPEGLPFAYANYFRICLDILEQSFEYSEWNDLRQKEFEYLKKVMTLNNMKKLSVKQKAKLFLMVKHTKMYKKIKKIA